MFKLSEEQSNLFQSILRELVETEEAQRMREFIQHGRVTTYEHCIRVARVSFWLNHKFRLGGNDASLVKGAFLHDFYLYDWHVKAHRPRLHGLHHAKTALANAEKHYPINAKERNIILSHMWPLTIRSFPRCREAAIVCLADKCCCVQESLFRR